MYHCFVHCIKMQPDFGSECFLKVPQRASRMHILGHMSQNFQGETLDPQITDGN